MRLTTILTIFLVLATATGMAVSGHPVEIEQKGTGGEEGAQTTIQLSPDGLQATFTDIEGEQVTVTDPMELRILATEIRLHDPARRGFTTREFVEADKAYTVIINGDFSMIYERDLGDPGPTLELFSDLREDTLTVMSSEDTCGGCAVVQGRSASLEYWDCSIMCPTCTCQYCVGGPCPDPSPAPPPPPPPAPDPWDTCQDFFWWGYQQCMVDFMMRSGDSTY